MSRILTDVSLRAWHPTVRADEIAQTFGLEPEVAHNVGVRRMTPAGNALAGNYDRSYVSMLLSKKVEVELDEELLRLSATLQKHAGYMLALNATGGKFELYVSLFLSGLGGFELDHSALLEICALGLGIAVELYPNDREVDAAICD